LTACCKNISPIFFPFSFYCDYYSPSFGICNGIPFDAHLFCCWGPLINQKRQLVIRAIQPFLDSGAPTGSDYRRPLLFFFFLNKKESCAVAAQNLMDV
jgi:hypothetical protein